MRRKKAIKSLQKIDNANILAPIELSEKNNSRKWVKLGLCAVCICVALIMTSLGFAQRRLSTFDVKELPAKVSIHIVSFNGKIYYCVDDDGLPREVNKKDVGEIIKIAEENENVLHGFTMRKYTETAEGAFDTVVIGEKEGKHYFFSFAFFQGLFSNVESVFERFEYEGIGLKKIVASEQWMESDLQIKTVEIDNAERLSSITEILDRASIVQSPNKYQKMTAEERNASQFFRKKICLKLIYNNQLVLTIILFPGSREFYFETCNDSDFYISMIETSTGEKILGLEKLNYFLDESQYDFLMKMVFDE